MNYVELFAGVGGFRKGIEEALPNSRCVFSNEWDKYAADTYDKNFGGAIDRRDITTIPVADIPDHDLLVGGFPCQAFSVAGKRLGFDDTRGTLFFEIARILRDKRPRHLLLENVKGLLSHDQGKTFQTILGVLADLGYRTEWQVLNSKDFGVPQNRERIFIVGHLGDGCTGQVFPVIGDDIEADGGAEQGEISGTIDTGYAKNHRQSGATYIVPTIRATQHKSGDNQTVVAEIGTWRTHKDGRGFRKMKEQISPTIPARAREDGSGQPVLAIRASGDRGKQKHYTSDEVGALSANPMSDSLPKVAVPVLTPDRKEKRQNGRRFKTNGEPAFTLNAQDQHGIYDGMRIRRLTPLECERLQGFPDGWTEGVSDTQRYKQMGNAVSVPVVAAVAGRLCG